MAKAFQEAMREGSERAISVGRLLRLAGILVFEARDGGGRTRQS